MKLSHLLLALAATVLPACHSNNSSSDASATGTTDASAEKAGFVVIEDKGRLWVFKAGAPELAQFQKTGELIQRVTRAGAGPGGKTIMGPDAATLDAYCAQK